MLNLNPLVKDRPHIKYATIERSVNVPHRFIVRFGCRCGFKGKDYFDEILLYSRGTYYFLLSVEEFLDRHLCATMERMDRFYEILHVVSRCLVEEVFDDTMKRFSLLEF